MGGTTSDSGVRAADTPSDPMKHQQTLATLIVAVLCSAVLVLFTDVEQDLLQQLKRFTQPRLERWGHVPKRMET